MSFAIQNRWKLRCWVLGIIALITLTACNNDNLSVAEGPKQNTDTTTSKPATPITATDTMAAAALEYCNCFKQAMGRFDPHTEELILKSVEQPEPMRFLETEIKKMTDPASQEQALKDLQTFSNFDAASPCILSVSRKYGIEETDPATLQRIIYALEKYPDCKLVTALFKIAYTDEQAPH